MLFEVINPSDPVVLEADDEIAAALACLLLGHGKYGLVREDGETVLPLMMFGADEALLAWVKEKGLVDDDQTVDDEFMGPIIRERQEAIGRCLASAMVCDLKHYLSLTKAMEAGGGDVQAARSAYCEDQRSSMNNICGRAHALAQEILDQIPA